MVTAPFFLFFSTIHSLRMYRMVSFSHIKQCKWILVKLFTIHLLVIFNEIVYNFIIIIFVFFYSDFAAGVCVCVCVSNAFLDGYYENFRFHFFNINILNYSINDSDDVFLVYSIRIFDIVW